MSTRRYLLLAGLLLLVVVFATHGRAVWSSYGFVNYDDGDVVVDNPRFDEPPLRAVGGILFGRTFLSWLPIYFLSLGLDRALFGLNPVGFHLVNVLLHAINALLVVAIGLRLSRDRRLALAAGLVFATLPGLTESVAWISSRKDVLSFLLAGLSILLALDSPRPEGGLRRRPYVASIVLLALSLLAKGTTLVVPLLLLAHGLLVREPGRALRPRQIVPHFVVAGALTLVHFLVARAEGVIGGASEGVLALLVADLGILGRYAAVLVVSPLQTVAHHVEVGVVDSWLVFGVVVLGAILAATVVGARRAPLLAVGAVWFLLALAPFNNVIPRTSLLLAERYLYVPALGAALVAAWAMARLPRGAFGLVLAVVVAALGAQTFARTAVWEDSGALWQDAVEKAPEAYLPHQKLGRHLITEKKYTDALGSLERAEERARTPGETVRTLGDRAFVLVALGRPSDALECVARARALAPELPGRDRKALLFQVAMTHGLAAQSLGRFDEALEAYREASTTAPENPQGPFDAGTLLQSMQRYDEAARALEECVRRARATAGGRSVLAPGLLNLASLHLSRGELDRAEERIAEAAEAGADEGALALRRARLLRRRGRSEDAFTLLEDAARRHPNDATLPRALATLRQAETRAALGDGDLERALREARGAVEWVPSDPEARLMLARILRQSGRPEEALAEIEAARVREGEAGPLRRERAEIRLRLAVGALEAGRWPEAARLAAAAIEDAPDRLDAGGMRLDPRLVSLIRAGVGDEDLAIGVALIAVKGPEAGGDRLGLAAQHESDPVAAAALATRGVSKAHRGDPEGASADLEAATRRAPDSSDARLLLAEVLEAGGDLASARAAYEAVAAAHPGLIEAHVGAALVLGREGDLVGALARLNRLAEAHPDRPDAHRAIADLYLQRHAVSPDPKMLEGARSQLLRAVEVDPRDARTLTRLASVWAAGGKTGEAIALLRRALEYRPDLDEARLSLAALYVRAGRAYLENGKLDEAEDLASRATALARDSVEGILLRGDVNRARERWTEARRDYERARVLDPEGDAPLDALAGWWKDEGYRRLYVKGDEAGAQEAFLAALALEPRNLDLSGVRDRLRVIEDRTRQAQNVEILLRNGREQLTAGRLAQAEATARAAVRIDGKSAPAHFFQAQVHEASNRRGEAESSYREALKHDPRYAPAELNLARLLYLTERDAEALKLYRAWLVHVDPESPGAADSIAQVRALIQKLRARVGEEDDGGR